MKITFRPMPRTYNAEQIQQNFDLLVRALINTINTKQAAPEFHLLAPDGGVWRVTIANDGTLTRTKVQG